MRAVRFWRLVVVVLLGTAVSLVRGGGATKGSFGLVSQRSTVLPPVVTRQPPRYGKAILRRTAVVSLPTASANESLPPPQQSTIRSTLLELRAGGSNTNTNNNRGLSYTHVEQSLKIVLDILTTTCSVVLPPVVAVTQTVSDLYRALPRDALLAQVGLVYCLAGGYFPTLFAAVSAAQHCGMAVVVDATSDLIDEAVRAVEAASASSSSQSSSSWGSSSNEPPTARQIVQQKTLIVLATIDPVKINQAVGALTTTWMGVAAVLEREFARTITLSLTLADYLRPASRLLLGPPLYRIVPEDYHAWVPVTVGWMCKAAAMSLAWRIQRVLTASSSAVAGGLLCSRALLRMAARRLPWLQRRGPIEATYLDEILGFGLAALGLYAQIGNGFSFQVPFPLNLVTWPFEIAERWIQWQITKE